MGRKDQIFGDPDPIDQTIVSPVIAIKATVHQEMPEQVVKTLRENNLKIRLDKLHAGRLVNQLPGMVASDGCISSPSGPSC